MENNEYLQYFCVFIWNILIIRHFFVPLHAVMCAII